MSLKVIPVSFRRLAANIKRGIASNGKFCVCEIGSCIIIVKGSCGFCRKKTVPEMPMAKATGIPITRKMINRINTSSIFPVLLTPGIKVYDRRVTGRIPALYHRVPNSRLKTEQPQPERLPVTIRFNMRGTGPVS
jgi:hypothetical protein